MAMRNAGEDWRRFSVENIPTKAATPHLDRLLAEIGASAAEGGQMALLDVGCGDGRLSRRLHDQGFWVTGVDISPAAVVAARRLAGDPAGTGLRFVEADFSADELPQVESGPFDIVVCQLVLSIIGDDRSRTNLLRHIRTLLRPEGWLYLSASGVSDSINAGYARLYAEDALLTGEPHSYFSRNDRGEILYPPLHDGRTGRPPRGNWLWADRGETRAGGEQPSAGGGGFLSLRHLPSGVNAGPSARSSQPDELFPEQRRQAAALASRSWIAVARRRTQPCSTSGLPGLPTAAVGQAMSPVSRCQVSFRAWGIEQALTFPVRRVSPLISSPPTPCSSSFMPVKRTIPDPA